MFSGPLYVLIFLFCLENKFLLKSIFFCQQKKINYWIQKFCMVQTFSKRFDNNNMVFSQYVPTNENVKSQDKNCFFSIKNLMNSTLHAFNLHVLPKFIKVVCILNYKMFCNFSCFWNSDEFHRLIIILFQ